MTSWAILLLFLHKTFDLCSLSQIVMEQFNPGLRNLVNLGKSYEKSVTGKHSSHLWILTPVWSLKSNPLKLKWSHSSCFPASNLIIVSLFSSECSDDSGWEGLLWRCLKGWRECYRVPGLQGARWVVFKSAFNLISRGLNCCVQVPLWCCSGLKKTTIPIIQL